MTDCYIGEIRLFAGTYAPAGWLDCNGSTLPIAQYEALYALLGTLYGGDGVNTFALPDLRGRLPIGCGKATGVTSYYALGQSGGATEVTLTTAQMPKHNHNEIASLAPASTTSPVGALLADPTDTYSLYTLHNSTNTVATMAADAIFPAGGSKAHNNMMPSIALRYIIAIKGIFPAES